SNNLEGHDDFLRAPSEAEDAGPQRVVRGVSATVNVATTDVLDMRPVKIGLQGPVVRMRKGQARLRLATWAFTTRRIPQGNACCILPPVGAPRVGDLVLARVDALGSHSGLHMVNG